MFAVIKTGGKQYRVKENDLIDVELLTGAAGDSITFDTVLAAGEGEKMEIGAPTLKKKVVATIVAQKKGEKLYIQKFRRRKDSKTRTGHRQKLTSVRITAIKDA